MQDGVRMTLRPRARRAEVGVDDEGDVGRGGGLARELDVGREVLQRERESGVRLAQKVQVGPRIPLGTQLERAEAGPTSGPTRRLSHLLRHAVAAAGWEGVVRALQEGGVVRAVA